MQEEIERETGRESTPAELALRGLWEKARLASALIATLQEQKSSLQQRIRELEHGAAQMHNEAVVKDMEIMQLRAELDRMQSMPPESAFLPPEERLELQGKIKVLLEKIQTHL